MRSVCLRPIVLGSAVSLLAFLFGCGGVDSEPLEVGASIPWPGESWSTSTPRDQGFDPLAIDSLLADVEAGEYGLVDDFLLIRNGMVVTSQHFNHDYAVIAAQYDTANHQYNYDYPEWHPYLRGTDLHTMQSVTKSVTSAALGIAIDEGFLEGVETPVMHFFSAYAPYETDVRKESATLEDFLTMRSGLQWNTAGGYGGGLHSTDQLEASDEWIRFVLDQPADTIPGTRFQYNDGVSVLLGKILREATGQRIDEWARERLFEPIGIREFYWKITPDGEADTEGGLYLSAEDLARIGYLFLRSGEWDGRQVISSQWVQASTSPVVADVAPNNDQFNVGYGYQWWVPDHESDTTKVFAGDGYGGQVLLVIPEHDIVAVFTGWSIHGGAGLPSWPDLIGRILSLVQ